MANWHPMSRRWTCQLLHINSKLGVDDCTAAVILAYERRIITQ